MSTDHVVALMGRILEKANGLIARELVKRGHPGLAPSHGAILAKLYARGALPMGALAEAIGRKKNTVTTLVAKLEREGYVARTTSTEDSRVTLVSLTPKGEAFREDFQAVSKVLLTAVWGDMPDADKAKAVHSLEHILKNLG